MVRELLILSFPLIIAGVIHMVVVKKAFFEFLAVPIHKKAFGANKTLRGFVVMPLAACFGVYVVSLIFPDSLLAQTHHQFSLGLLLGLAYSLGELPNSFLKRKLKIKPGEQAQEFRWFFIILDRTDSALFVAITYFIWGLPMLISFLLIPFNLILHPLVTVPLYLLGIKKKIL